MHSSVISIDSITKRGQWPAPRARADQWRKVEVVLKLAAVCNLDCDYCYFFHGGDNSFEEHPNFISAKTVHEVTAFLARTAREFSEGPRLAVAGIVDPLQREACRIARGPLVEHIAGEIEARRRLPLERGAGFFVGSDAGGLRHVVSLRDQGRVARQNQLSAIARQVSSTLASSAQRSPTRGSS